MRYVYIKKSHERLRDSCRGGVLSRHGGNEFDLEIGNGKNACIEMLAFCSMIDEIKEFLELSQSQSPLAGIILNKWKSEKKRLDDSYQ
jgi:hypothetical protein